jgi:hypothetical protein
MKRGEKVYKLGRKLKRSGGIIGSIGKEKAWVGRCWVGRRDGVIGREGKAGRKDGGHRSVCRRLG